MIVVFFIVTSESKRLPGTDFNAEDMKENIRVIFAYIASNGEFFLSNIRHFEYEPHIRPILNGFMCELHYCCSMASKSNITAYICHFNNFPIYFSHLGNILKPEFQHNIQVKACVWLSFFSSSDKVFSKQLHRAIGKTLIKTIFDSKSCSL